MISKEFKDVILIDSKVNLGFVKANNLAIKKAKGKYILLLNPDTEILSSALNKCYEFMEKNPKIDVLGCKQFNGDMSLQNSCRRFPQLFDQILVLLKMHNFFYNKNPIKRYYMFDFDYTTVREVDQIMGAFMFFKRKVYEDIGLFDENIFQWFEEVDWCKRAKDKGYKIMFYPHASIIHHKGASFAQSLDKQQRFNKSLLYYFQKHHRKYAQIILICLIPVNLFLTNITPFFLKIFRFKKNKNL
jgi:hypothetical protein